MIKDALTVARKDLQILFQDRGELIVLFLMPIMFASILGTAFSGGTPGLSIYLVNQDTGEVGAQIASILDRIDALHITKLDTVEQADRKIANGEALAAVVIPADFSQKIDASAQARVRVIVDPTQQQFGSIVTGIMDAVVPAVIKFQLGEALQEPLITVRSEDLEGIKSQELDSAYSYTTPAYAVMFAFFIVGTIAGSLLAEKETGTFLRLLAAPIHRGAIIFGKMLAFVLVVGLQVLVVFGVGNVFFDIPLGNSPLGLLLLTLALALTATSLGMLVAALSRTRGQVAAVGMVISLVLAILGGVAIPIPEEGFLHVLSLFTPHAHALEGFLKLTTQGAGVVEVLPQAGLLLGVAAMFFSVAVWRFKFE